MLTEDEERDATWESEEAVRGYEAELLAMMAGEVRRAAALPPAERARSQARVARRAAQIAKRWRPRIERAVRRDLEGAMYLNLTRELDRLGGE